MMPVPRRKASVRDRDRELHRLQGAEALVRELARVWWGRWALKWALGRIGRA